MKIQNAKTYPFLIVPLVLGIPTLLCAEVKLATIFSDHMVLQKGKPVSVWGWADPGEQITVTFADQTKTTTAGTPKCNLYNGAGLPASPFRTDDDVQRPPL